MIQIPDPCNEDFSKMSPTEKGAFCNKCSTDTYDFRHLSNVQINTIVREHAGKHLCGRINSNQLNELNQGFINWKNQNARTFQSKFILALILVFGLGLFSCEDDDKVALEEISKIELSDVVGKLEYINTDFNINEVDLLNYIEENDNSEIPDQVVCEPNTALGGVIAYEEELMFETRGKIAIAGGIGLDPQYLEYVDAVISEDSIEPILPTPITSVPFTAKAFPNPTQGLSTIALDIQNEGQFEINLYNLNGQLVENIHSGILSSGRNNFETDLSDMQSGLYFVKIISQGQNETIKISKVN